jgi:L-iditol 2-dehydrogenase
MGLLFAQVLPAYTPAARFGAGRRDEGLRLAQTFNMDAVWDVRATPLSERIAAAGLFDCVIECTGNLEGWRQAFAATAPGGQVLLFGGLPRGTDIALDSYRLHYEEVRVLGSFHFAPRDVAKARALLLAGDLQLSSLISDCVPLARLPEALARLQQGQGIQYAIDPWS